MNPPTLASLPTEPAALLPVPPASIGRFLIRSEIGRGANGVVYSAHDPVLDREVAIKAIPLGGDTFFREQIEANFLNEAKAAGGLNHPNIVTVFDAGKNEQLAYIAMERLQGQDLHDALATGQRLSFARTASLMARVADAVHFAHKRGIIHRDIKPSNIFITRDGKPKVLDFGVALPMIGNANSMQRRQLIGTPNYMSPEQALGRKLDARSDVFALGAVLYELLAGRRAFEGKDTEQTLMQVISDAPRPLRELCPEVPEPLRRIVERALSKDAEQRFPTAAELRKELAAFSASSAPAAAPAPAAPTVWRSTRGRSILVVGAALALLAGVLVNQRSPAPEPVVTAAVPAPAPVAPDPAVVAAPTQTPVPVPLPLPPVTPDVTTAPRPAEGKPGPARAAAPRPRDGGGASGATPATGNGTVALAIAPWGEVLIDGTSRGVAPPLTSLSLPPGTYQIEVRNGAFPPYRARVEVRPGQLVALQHRF